MTKEARVTVLVSHLRLGGHPFQEEEITYRRGQELNLPEDYAIRLGTSVSIHPHKPEPKPEPETEPTPQVQEEPEPEPEPLKQIQDLPRDEALKVINNTESTIDLAKYLKLEKTGKKRKKIMDAINAKIAA